MSLKWTGNRSESGILRKSEFKEKKEELFVFGYSCKLFRDNEKALHIDQGKHLIPWMGDETLKIDRYDARGALHDLTPLEAPPGGYDWRVELTKAEQDVEQLCDEERYRALHTDEDEEEMYKEEELKRLHAAGYGQVGFNYDPPPEPEAAPPAEVEEPFEPTDTFRALLPENTIFPDTLKQNAIIEKTAKFIASQGAQMEILIKAKQGDNPQFQFLNKDSNLNAYYTALCGLVRAGKWPEKKQEVVEEKPADNEDYLHPSLASTVIESAPSIPSIHYRPSADCDYTMLVCKLRGSPAPEETYSECIERAPGEVAPPGTEPLPPRAPPADIARAPVMYRRDPAAPSDQPTVPAQYQYQYYSQQAAVPPPAPAPAPVAKAPAAASAPLVSTGLSLMKNYNTDSETDDSDSDDTSSENSKSPAILTPPEDVQIVIDKMAAYVARNGDEFAEIVRAKNDPRFTFLEPNNAYHPYYKRLMQQKRGVDVNGTAKETKKSSGLTPPEDVIDKMAAYVARNGDEFAEIVRAKNDPRFTFLEPNNAYHPYYKRLMQQKRGIDVNGTAKEAKKSAGKTPPKDVIDKMAAYVARNGDEFAEIVRAKNDPRFTFLEPNNAYHPYYKRLMQQKRGVAVDVNGVGKEAKKSSAPVCFSIKKQKEPDPILPKPALPYESSSDEESEKQEKTEEPKEPVKPTTQALPAPAVPQAIVYKIEKAEPVLMETAKSSPKSLTPEIKEIPKADIKTTSSKVPEVKTNVEEYKTPLVEEKKSNSPVREKRKYKERKKEYRSKSEASERRTEKRNSEREKRKEKKGERVKKRRIVKDDLENEVISLDDNTDDLIDLTGDQSDSKGEVDTEAEKAKQLERRRRAAEFLRKVGVDPAAPLPATSLASAMVDTLESLRKKKAEEEEKRRKREKRRHRDRYEYENGAERSHRKSKRRRRSSEEDESDDGKRKKRKKDKKHSTKSKKRRRREPELVEDEEEEMDEPLNIDLTNTLKELRNSSPTKELVQDIDESTQQSLRKESSEEEGEMRKEKKKKKEDREYSEGEWSSDSEQDSASSASGVEE